MGLAACVTTQGGSDIETLSAEHPDAIFKIPIDIAEGVTPEKLELVADKLGFQSTKVCATIRCRAHYTSVSD